MSNFPHDRRYINDDDTDSDKGFVDSKQMRRQRRQQKNRYRHREDRDESMRSNANAVAITVPARRSKLQKNKIVLDHRRIKTLHDAETIANEEE